MTAPQRSSVQVGITEEAMTTNIGRPFPSNNGNRKEPAMVRFKLTKLGVGGLGLAERRI